MTALPAWEGQPLPQEEAFLEARDGRAYADLLERLSRQSVAKHFDAYADVPWDDPAFHLDPEDPRFELLGYDPLGATDWYRSLPAATRARIGCHMLAHFAKTGLQFESALKQGLLQFADTLPNGAPEFRYAYHELIEEGQHALMFQEFVNRSGTQAKGLGRAARAGGCWLASLGHTFPELFFVFVLAGEDPVDHFQREALGQAQRHPLVRRINQIHVIEEARHLSFARAYLRSRVPALSALKRHMLSLGAALILRQAALLMIRPPRELVERYAIPQAVLRAAYHRNPRTQQRVLASLAKTRALCVELGLLRGFHARLWSWLGLLEGDAR